ncbi:MAG: RNA 2',3'-cyclic phosphodiesterase [Bacteroidota bacterium]|nr:RNA 2',3'-cyclic phosphodiesterase [Bacteroidota bacterium]
MDGKRIFLAMPVEPVEPAVELALRLKMRLPAYRIKWEDEKKYHLTLFFFGQVPVSQLSAIQETLFTLLQQVPVFDCLLTGPGLFKSGKEPRVLWLGLKMPDSFTLLKEQIDQAMANLGFLPDNEPFQPHLTLGRFSKGQNTSPELDDALSAMQPLTPFRLQASKLILFESRLSAAGSRYFPIEEFHLKQPTGQ